MDHNGEFWDKVSHKKLDAERVRNVRLHKSKQLYTHRVYEKFPAQECWDATGNEPVQVKWVDINKGDAIHQEYGTRLVANKNQGGQKE